MALFKPMMGNRTALDAQEKRAGYAWFCTDDGTFYIDYEDADGNLQRKQINESDLNAINDKIKAIGSGDNAITVITLSANGWTDNTQVVAVEGVTSDNNILVSANGEPTSYIRAGVYCSAQAEGSLTFKCATTPTEDIMVNVIIGAIIPSEEVLTVDSAMSDVSTNPVQNKVIKQYIDEKGDNAITVVTLSAADWVDNMQTVEVAGVEADSNIFVTPSGDPTLYAEAGVYCFGQADGVLTFVCDTTPTEDVLVNVIIGGNVSGEQLITIDGAMSDASANPVQNKVIKAYVDEKAGKADYKLGIMTADGGTVRTYYDGSAEVNIDVVKAAQCDANGNVISDTYAKTGSLATVATSGDYNDLGNKPTIPTALPTPNGLIIFEHTADVSPLITSWDGSTARTIHTVHSAHRDSANNVISETYVKLSQLGKATSNGVTGVATLGEDTKIPATQLPLDTALSDTSTNPVQNKVIKEAIDAITESLGGVGTGDMLKSVYDTNNDGVVDYATTATQVHSPLIVETWLKESDQLLQVPYDGAVGMYVPGVRCARSADRDGDGNVIADTYAKTGSLATVATSGLYNDLSGKPTIPTALPTPNSLTIAVVENGGTITRSFDGSSAVTINTVKSAQCDADGQVISETYVKEGALATVATSGSYNDLSYKPTSLPNPHVLTINGVSYDGSEAKTITVDTAMSDESENLVQNKTIKKYIDDAIFAVLNTEV